MSTSGSVIRVLVICDIYMYIYTHTHTHTYIYICIYTHTHIYTSIHININKHLGICDSRVGHVRVNARTTLPVGARAYINIDANK